MNPAFTLFWFLGSLAFAYIGFYFQEAAAKSRGKGTWKADQHRLTLSGAAFAYAILCYALGIASRLS